MAHSDHSRTRSDRGVGGERVSGVMYRRARKGVKIPSARRAIQDALGEMSDSVRFVGNSTIEMVRDCESGFDAFMV